MLYLHKIIPSLILPLGLCILLLIGALIWRKRILILIPLLILSLASNPLVSSCLLSSLENRYPKIEIADCPNADAIVVLSGILGGKRSQRESLELNWGEAYDRFDAAIRLYQAGKAPCLVLTDPRMPWETPNEWSEGQQLVAATVERGVPRNKIILLGPVGNTADEARLTAHLASEKKWRRIILVTTAWHMPRAKLLFDALGCEVTPFPTDFQTMGRANWSLPLSLFPSTKYLMQTECYVREIMGFWYYHFFSAGRK